MRLLARRMEDVTSQSHRVDQKTGQWEAAMQKQLTKQYLTGARLTGDLAWDAGPAASVILLKVVSVVGMSTSEGEMG